MFQNVTIDQNDHSEHVLGLYSSFSNYSLPGLSSSHAGLAFDTKFSGNCVGWLATGGSKSGLSYSYKFSRRNETISYSMFYSGTIPAFSGVAFPLGYSSDSFYLRVTVFITDSIGDWSEYPIDIVVSITKIYNLGT